MNLARRLIRQRTMLFGGLLAGLMVASGVAAPWIASHDPTSIDAKHRLEGISRVHLLGTDALGRDVYSRVVYGARVSLFVSFAGVGIALVVGVVAGLIAGYNGGLVDTMVMILVDMIFAFPALLLALIIAAALGVGPIGVVIAISVVYTPAFTRVVRGGVLSTTKEVYVEAARSVGVPGYRILLRHVLPNMVAPILVLYTLRLGQGILTEASLSFLGLGIQPPTPAWGYMLFDGKTFMELSPWVVIGPGLAIVLSILGFSLLGDGLRDLLDPTMRT